MNFTKRKNVRRNLTMQICLLRFDAGKFINAKISTFTVFKFTLRLFRTVLQYPCKFVGFPISFVVYRSVCSKRGNVTSRKEVYIHVVNEIIV